LLLFGTLSFSPQFSHPIQLFLDPSYWAIGLHPGPIAFFRFLSFLFIAVYIAEAQSVLVAAVIPIFVAALAIASFLNGFWMVHPSFRFCSLDHNCLMLSYFSVCKDTSSEP
jgi:ATP-binding cassette, subfamily G (WHITE), member 2